MDRNIFGLNVQNLPLRSLSARRAWIEIIVQLVMIKYLTVALRKESVDRNSTAPVNLMVSTTSLSARRAWIEIFGGACAKRLPPVALRKESVDRNHVGNSTAALPSVALRKESVDRNSSLESKQIDPSVSLSARRAWIEIPLSTT